MAKRNYIFNTICEVFYRYGLSTDRDSSMENLSTLMGEVMERKAISRFSRFRIQVTIFLTDR